ncbi:MAG: glycosyltransferase family 2 protein [Pseudomonadota bacterium]
MSDRHLHLTDPEIAQRTNPPRPLGRYLIEAGVISTQDLLHALDLQRYVDAPLGEILIAEGLVASQDVMQALARQHRTRLVDLQEAPPQLELATRLPAPLCLAFTVVPWSSLGDTLLVATSRPHLFDDMTKALGPSGQTILPVIADEHDIQAQITRLYGRELAHRAATRVPAISSCRTWDIETRKRALCALVLLGMLGLACALYPLAMLTAIVLLAVVTLIMTTILKAAALWAQVIQTSPAHVSVPSMILPYRLPRVSMLVPLLREKEIAGHLIERLEKLTYPKSLLDVILVLEEGDHVTRQTLSETKLPNWISVVEVPQANSLKTKPRALNYALDFCRGSIIGVWDAEDAPERDQLEKVVSRFRVAPEKVACLQGMLDYYNPRANWLARCFTIEYATWWRMLLPGVARLGLVIPLGGTTLFFRRHALEKLHGWDAHNVTEDADLGMRLARAGYVTELLPTVTHEEANCRFWPWIRQRSRWLKGFLITWCVHMRNPLQLLADLGWIRFLGVQTILLATVCQFLLAPFLWSFWLALAGFAHPVEVTLGTPALWAMISLFIFAETLNLAMSLVAVSGKEHKHLIWCVFTLPFYFLFGAAAALKGGYEFVVRPFFWDKTEHGVSEDRAQVSLPVPAAQLPASDA